MRRSTREPSLILWIVSCLLLTGIGCQPNTEVTSFPIHVSRPNRSSPSLLLSEVQRAEVPTDLLDAEFVLENRSSIPQSFQLAGKSCSCYGVQVDGRSLELHEPVAIPPLESVVLTFDVAPPLSAEESSWSIRLTSVEEPEKEMRLALQVRVYADARFEPDAIVSSLPTSSTRETKRQSAERTHRLLVRQTWRGSKDDGNRPVLSGLPDGWSFTQPVPDGTAQKIEDELWQQAWSSEITNRPVGVTSNAGQQEVRLKVTSSAANGFVAIAPDGNPTKAVPGAYRMTATFANPAGRSIYAYGRFLVRESSGVQAPTIVHWGRIEIDSPRARRIMLSASDRRPFTINDIRLKQKAQAGASATGGFEKLVDKEKVAWRFTSDDVEIDVFSVTNQASERHSLELRIVPHRESEFDETLVMETDHPLTELVKVRLRAIVLSSSSD